MLTAPPISAGAFWCSTVRPIKSDEELDLIARLRYRVYVDEMGKPYPHADHRRERLTDPLDSVSDILGAFDDEGLFGTVRCTSATQPALHDIYGDPLALNLWADVTPSALVVCSRFVVDHGHAEDGSPGSRSCARCTLGREKGIRVCLCSTALPLVGFFQRFGFRSYGPPFVDGDSARAQQRLALLLEDTAHLQKVPSPFLSGATGRDNPFPPSGWLDRLSE